MESPNVTNTQIDSCVESEPIVVGSRTLQPVVRVTGWRRAGADGVDGWGGALLHLAAHEIVVREGAQTHTLSVTDPLAESMRRVARQALLISGLCLFIMLLVRWMERRRKRK